MVTGLTIGFYDGAIGPGTGSFLVFALVGVLGYNFLEASAKAKLANWATNLAALIVFVPQGAVIWQLALPMAAANIAGGYLGARLAMARGASRLCVLPRRRRRLRGPARRAAARLVVSGARGRER